MNIILYDDHQTDSLLPFTHTKACAQLRCGILTLAEKWEKYFKASIYLKTKSQLDNTNLLPKEQAILHINGRLLANEALAMQIKRLRPREALYQENDLLAYFGLPKESTFTAEGRVESRQKAVLLEFPWDIFLNNEQQIVADFQLLGGSAQSASLKNNVSCNSAELIYIDIEAKLEHCHLNACEGPIYIAAGALVMDGANLRGPIAILENSVVKMGAKIYGGTTIGPGCKVGGEVQNVVFMDNSNKGHDGYLGNAVIGSWCNLGADTNSSNLKNDYGMVKAYSEAEGKEINTDLQFCGLMMGDHSKCGINTMFNTGTVVGVSANIFGGGFPPKFIPSFSWGGAEGMSTYRLEKALKTADAVLARRNLTLTEQEISLFTEIFENTKQQRNDD